MHVKCFPFKEKTEFYITMSHHWQCQRNMFQPYWRMKVLCSLLTLLAERFLSALRDELSRNVNAVRLLRRQRWYNVPPQLARWPKICRNQTSHQAKLRNRPDSTLYIVCKQTSTAMGKISIAPSETSWKMIKWEVCVNTRNPAHKLMWNKSVYSQQGKQTHFQWVFQL